MDTRRSVPKHRPYRRTTPDARRREQEQERRRTLQYGDIRQKRYRCPFFAMNRRAGGQDNTGGTSAFVAHANCGDRPSRSKMCSLSSSGKVVLVRTFGVWNSFAYQITVSSGQLQRGKDVRRREGRGSSETWWSSRASRTVAVCCHMWWRSCPSGLGTTRRHHVGRSSGRRRNETEAVRSELPRKPSNECLDTCGHWSGGRVVEVCRCRNVVRP
ncbi:hypothetical protein C2E23DRAFT_314002 [Lenzites betulinus]|nr:hypothetical protein C2E23DRAFT_314002 [Lenzites betulinus]